MPDGRQQQVCLHHLYTPLLARKSTKCTRHFIPIPSLNVIFTFFINRKINLHCSCCSRIASITLNFTSVSERNVAPFFSPCEVPWCHTDRVRSANAVVWRFVTRARFGCCRRVNELGRELWRRTAREWMQALCACDRERQIRAPTRCMWEREGWSIHGTGYTDSVLADG